MKKSFWAVLIAIAALSAQVGWAQPAITVSLAPGPPGPEIAPDFVGLSFEISNLLPDKTGRHLFSPTNQPLIALFRNVGIKSLRVGGGTAELPNYPDPAFADIDQLFAFAEAADVKVIYTLRLLNGRRTNAASTASYILRRYSRRLACFCLGNEPDWHSYHSYPGHALDPAITETEPGVPGSAYPSFLVQWRNFAGGITAVVPGAVFGGPDTGSNYPVPGAKDTDYHGRSWTEQFANDERGSGRLESVFLHDYVGQSARGVSTATAVDAMLSRRWLDTNYYVLYDHVLAPLKRLGVPWRMTECNDYTGGVEGASDGFVSALWALDYMHWQAAHGTAGVNFHNKRWIRTCTIYEDSSGKLHLHPKAYGLKAFALGSRGHVEALTVQNPSSVNVTAYAVRSTAFGRAGSPLPAGWGSNGAQRTARPTFQLRETSAEHVITLINKEHGSQALATRILLSLPQATNATVMFLVAPAANPSATNGVTLGGGTLTADQPWSGHWDPVESVRPGEYSFTLPPLSAAVVRIWTREGTR